MSADWQVGDLAVCISRHPEYPPEVQEGHAFTVERVWVDIPYADGSCPGLALTFIEVPRMDGGDTGYDAIRFRKIRPDEHQACEEEFVTLLKRSRKRVSA